MYIQRMKGNRTIKLFRWYLTRPRAYIEHFAYRTLKSVSFVLLTLSSGSICMRNVM